MTNVDVTVGDLVDLVGTRLPVETFVDRITMMGSGPEGVVGEVLTFDIFPNRPDLYSVEGIARGLRAYLGLETGLPHFEVTPSGIEFRVDPSVDRVRPFAVGGIVRGVELEDALLRSLVDLQEKLHLTLGRKRRKVAIGIHDLDRVVPPFAYRAVPPHEVRFVPLGLAEEMDLAAILERHEKGIEFGSILAGADAYPIIVDRDGTVLSFPPIINGITTALTAETRNLFIDVTGTDRSAVSGALSILVTSLAERGGRIESVRTVTAGGTSDTPDLTPTPHTLDLRRANERLGLRLTADEAVGLLGRMRYEARAEGAVLQVLAPAYRTDLLHEFDIAEDLAIAWGYDRYPRDLPRRQTIGTPHPLNEFSDALRVLLIGYGYQEIMSLTVTSPSGPFTGPDRVRIVNPVAEELSSLRTSLVPGLLNLFGLNKHRELPQRAFEVADAVVDAENVRRLGLAAIHPKASFTEGKSLALSLARDVGKTAEVEAVEDPNFIPGRAAIVRISGVEAGRFGEIHPRILEAHGLVQPVMALELDVARLTG
jgi:phenylalanyl-tRNA synthetase beta chain